MKQRSHSKSGIETGSQGLFFQKKHNDNFFGQSYKPFFNSSFIQAKLTGQQPDEGNEQEADNGADHVSHRSTTSFANDDESNNQDNISILQKCAECEDNSKNDLPLNENTSPEIISRQLGKGKPLNGATQSRMETGFGAEFSNVEIHNDSNAADLSEKMNARAFTVGKHIAFGTGEYAPGTIQGEGLIAHELAHVVQQNAGMTSSVQQKGNSEYRELETEADNAATDVMMSSWGKSDLKNRVSPKRIMPKLKSGLRIQRCAGVQKKATGPTIDPEKMKLIRRFRSERLEQRDTEIQDAGKLLGQISEWADKEKDKQKLPEGIGVVGLAPNQLDNAVKALAILKKNRSQYDTKGLAPVVTNLQDCNKQVKSVKKFIDRDEQEFKLELKAGLIKAAEPLDAAESNLEKVRDYVDGYPLYVEIEKSKEMLDKIKEGKVDQDTGIDALVEQNKSIISKIHQIEAQFAHQPEAIDRIAFVVQYFIAINKKDHAGQPSVEEMKKFSTQLAGSLAMDMNLVFGDGTAANAKLFVTFGEMLSNQLAIRLSMIKAGLPDAMVPSQKDIGEYFKSLSKKSNGEVRAAYQTYAQGFFYHRIVTNIDDMNLSNVSEIFSRETSITAARPLVCSGYAILGAFLISKAGGQVVRFTSAVRATDDDILSDTISDGHAITHMVRAGKHFFVSNDLIVDREEDAIGPGAVAWHEPNAPLHKASGATNGAGLSALKKVIIRKKADLLKKKTK